MLKFLETELFDFFKLGEHDVIIPGRSPVPIYTSQVSCGFPNPAADFCEERIDISDYLIPNPISTFLVRAKGNSMEGSRIFDNSLLIIDRSIKPANGSICLCVFNSEFTVKRFSKTSSGIQLLASNNRYEPITITPDMDFEIWGVITQVVSRPI
jgi:DNA polymerase V